VPAEIASKVAAYQSKKSTLKKELYEAVHSADGATFGFFRGQMKSLADKQAARLAELDTLAEEIRRGLSQMPPPVAQRSPLPADVDARLATMIASYHDSQTQAVEEIEAILARAKDLPLQATYRFEGENLKFLVVPTRHAGSGRSTGAALSKVEAVRAEISAVADKYGRRLAEMLNERESIRAAIGESLKLTKKDDLDRALFAALRVANQKQTENSFSEYRIAVFEPGLSPEQRRLLFDGVIERLELPLPRGDLQPGPRAERW
jgi:hypothetical protein